MPRNQLSIILACLFYIVFFLFFYWVQITWNQFAVFLTVTVTPLLTESNYYQHHDLKSLKMYYTCQWSLSCLINYYIIKFIETKRISATLILIYLHSQSNSFPDMMAGKLFDWLSKNIKPSFLFFCSILNFWLQPNLTFFLACNSKNLKV